MAFNTSLLFHSLHFLAFILVLSITGTEEAAVRGEGHGRSVFMNPINMGRTVEDFKTEFQAAKDAARAARKIDDIYDKTQNVIQSNCLSNGESGSGITCQSGNDCQQYCNDGAVRNVFNCYNKGLKECFGSGTPVVPNQDTTSANASGEREYITTGLSWVLFMFAISFVWMF